MKKIGSIILVSILGVLCFSLSISAATLRKSKEGVIIFAIPDGGWESVDYKVIYTEDYSTFNTNYYIYNHRVRFYEALSNTFSACPIEFWVGNVDHETNYGKTIKTFKSWKREDGLFDGYYNLFGTSSNSEQSTYSKGSGNIGRLYFSCTCADGNVPYRGYNVKMELK